MKTFFIILFLAFANAVITESFAQTAKSDSITNLLKLKSLHKERDRLLHEIKQQDKKRDAQINGMTPERQEEMNNHQDSICLELRSQLVDVMLAIKERTPAIGSSQLLQQYNNLLKWKKDEDTSI